MDGRTRVDRIARVIQELRADIIALQEVVRAPNGSPEDDQAAWLHAQLPGFNLAFGENRRHRSGAYGNAILSRYPIVEIDNYDLSWRGRERRGCLRADVQLPAGNILHVFNVHLGTAFLERRHQGRLLVSASMLGRKVSGPRIVLGDFNEWTRGLATKLLSVHFESLRPKVLMGRARTYPGLIPVLHLDHIYFDRTLRLTKMSLDRSRRALLASDHLPLIADFEVE